MKSSSITAVAIVLAAAFARSLWAEDSTFIYVDMKETESSSLGTKIISKPQTTCPVSGKPIDKKLYMDYKGKRIYVCSQACLAQAKKNPRKYLQKLAETGQGVETVLFPDDGKKTPKKTAMRPIVSSPGTEK